MRYSFEQNKRVTFFRNFLLPDNSKIIGKQQQWRLLRFCKQGISSLLGIYYTLQDACKALLLNYSYFPSILHIITFFFFPIALSLAFPYIFIQFH